MPSIEPRRVTKSGERDRNKAAVRQVLKAFNTGDTSLIDKVVHPNLVDFNPCPGITQTNIQSLKLQIPMLREQFPDVEFKEQGMVAEGDVVVFQWLMTGTNTGPIFGRKPTGRRITHTGTEFIRFKDGLIIEHHDSADVLDFLDKLGVLDQEMLDYVRNIQAATVRARNKAVVREVLNAFNTGNTETINRLISADVADSSAKSLGPELTAAQLRGVQGVERQVSFFSAAFSDLHFEEVDLVAEGDQVILCWKMTGTNTGPVFGRKATGKTISHHGVEILRLEDGMIVEHADVARPLEFADKLGVLDERLLKSWKAAGLRDYSHD